MLAPSNQAHLASAHLVFLNIAFVQEVGMRVCICMRACVCVCLYVCVCVCVHMSLSQTSLAIFKLL